MKYGLGFQGFGPAGRKGLIARQGSASDDEN